MTKKKNEVETDVVESEDVVEENSSDSSFFNHIRSKIKLKKPSEYLKQRTIPTIFTSLNRCLGGGITTHCSYEFYGDNNLGKTTLSLAILAQMQKLGNYVVLCNTEKTFDKIYWESLGLDLSDEKFVYYHPKDYEMAIDSTKEIMFEFRDWKRKKKISDEVNIFLMFDTINTFVSRENTDVKREFKTREIPVEAGITSRFFKLLTSFTEEDVAFFIVNQVRCNTDKKGMFDVDNKPAGGKSPGFSASKRIEMTGKTKIKNSSDFIICEELRYKIIKSKISGSSDKTGKIYTRTDKNSKGIGLDLEREALEEAISCLELDSPRMGLIEKDSTKDIIELNGTKVILFPNEEKIIHTGKPKTISFLQNEPEMFNKLVNALNKRYL